MKYLFFSLLLTFSFSVSSEENKNPNLSIEYNFDTMLEEFRPQRAGTVEITLFKKLQFQAELNELPSPRKSKYLKSLLAQFSGNPHLKATMGMMMKSSKGTLWNVYVLDELVPQIEEQLNVGDQLTLQAYHAYNSDYGPGLLVYAFERHAAPGFWQQAREQARIWVSSFYE